MRVGLGYDLHRLDESSRKPIRMAGVEIESATGVVAHSDGDVVCHAITDALLGAAGLGDIGEYFPDTDPQFQNMEGLAFVREARLMVEKQGFIIQNVDCVIAMERPKLLPYKEQIQRELSDELGAPVGIKAKTGEGIGEIGRGEAIACWATALITGANDA